MARQIVFMDFETRSEVNVSDVGAPKYAADPSTVPLMLSYGTKARHAQWRLDLQLAPGEPQACPDDLVALIEDPEVEFHAHNAGFEIAIWDAICVGRWGWPAIPLDRWHCTAAKGAAANQPRALDKIANRLGLRERKDKDGKELIKAMSIPVKAQKTAKRVKKDKDGERVKDENGRLVYVPNKLSVAYQEGLGTEFFDGKQEGASYFFNNDPELWQRFLAYNLQDIVAEEAVDGSLPSMSELERRVWLLDQQINRRGIPVDVDLCRGALAVYENEVQEFHRRMADLTGGTVTKCSQRQRIVEWLNERVNFGESLAKPIVEEWLDKPNIPEEVREVLQLRQDAGGTAVSKYKAALQYIQEDGRCRDQLLYCGATTTGRWSGKGIQPHNFKRVKTPDETIIDAIKTGSRELVAFCADTTGTTVLALLQRSLRGLICFPAGHKAIVSDFAGIESRVLNWLCQNEVKLELFRKEQDAYIHTALDVYDCKYEDIATWTGKKWKIKKEHEDKRQIGKACELGLGYGMGAATFQVNAARAGSILSASFAEEVVHKWRSANSEIPAFWNRIESAVRYVIKDKYKRATVGPLKVYWDPRHYLCIELPSGRLLRYFKARIDLKDGKVYYLDGGKMGKRENAYAIDTYGGKLTENIVQAISRDLLVHSMLLIDAAGLEIVFHVHDEVVVEVDENDTEALGIVHKAMETIPRWAAGLPLNAETQEVRRYTK